MQQFMIFFCKIVTDSMLITRKTASLWPKTEMFLDKFGDASAIKVDFIAFGLHKFWINLEAPQQLK